MAKRKTSASEGKLWGGLKLSWTAFRIAKAKGKKKQYTLTKTGEEFIEKNLSKKKTA